ncbi:kinase-like domain-containing protein [Chaetomium fimeti]|uniref:Kinase-like domain-containing protein n=1 Tax=Chaetomium fimeti TaxID=1854472 RepID=A0AAE0LRI0_9PEZI|nr:kinase-like domain-containing protein [Chaetomium fimeti]
MVVEKRPNTADEADLKVSKRLKTTEEADITVGKRPEIRNEADLTIWMCMDTVTGVQHTQWYHFTPENETYYGYSDKRRFDITFDEFVAGLERISDDAIFPEVPTDTQITIAPKSLDADTVHIKRSGLRRYENAEKGSTCGAKDQLLAEVLVMEKLSKTPHPYIVEYYGCTVHRGRITSIATEKLGQPLSVYAYDDPHRFNQIDKAAFLAGVESAVKFLHSLGLAHNDISPLNIMVREPSNGVGACTPVLIDFDSCGPFGTQPLSLGSPGFCDEEDEDFTSQKRHDEFALKRLAEWWDEEHDPKKLLCFGCGGKKD